MNPPMPDSVCKEEMQSDTVDTHDIIIEYITDAQGRKIKKLKPLLIKWNQRENIFNMYTVTITFLMFPKITSYRRER